MVNASLSGDSASGLKNKRFMTRKTSKAYLGVASLTYAAVRRIPEHLTNTRPEASEAASANLGIPLSANATTTVEAVQVASDAASSDLFPATSTNAAAIGAPQKPANVCLQARKATCANLSVALIACSATMAEAVQEARETRHSYLTRATMTNVTRRSAEQEVEHVHLKPSVASSRKPGKVMLANKTPAIEAVQVTGDAQLSNLFASALRCHMEGVYARACKCQNS